jgi:hypothetical protein
VHLAQSRIQVDAVGQGCTVDDVGDVGQGIGDGYQVAFLRGGDEFAYLLLEQGDAELG